MRNHLTPVSETNLKSDIITKIGNANVAFTSRIRNIRTRKNRREHRSGFIIPQDTSAGESWRIAQFGERGA